MYHQTQTLVIGGGVGICCSYYLNELGKQVTIVEKSGVEGIYRRDANHRNWGRFFPAGCSA